MLANVRRLNRIKTEESGGLRGHEAIIQELIKHNAISSAI